MGNKKLTINDLWLGMRVQARLKDGTYKGTVCLIALLGNNEPVVGIYFPVYRGLGHIHESHSFTDKFTPILRRWDSMTDDEVQELADIVGLHRKKGNWKNWVKGYKATYECRSNKIVVRNCIKLKGRFCEIYENGHIFHKDLPPAAVRWCQEHGIDHNRWIDDGLAIDVETLSGFPQWLRYT